MVWSQIILPRADVRCGKIFHQDRGSARGQKVALEFWYAATGITREGSRLAVYRCKRCGGFHIGWKQKRADRPSNHRGAPENQPIDANDFVEDEFLDDDDSVAPSSGHALGSPACSHRLGGSVRSSRPAPPALRAAR